MRFRLCLEKRPLGIFMKPTKNEKTGMFSNPESHPKNTNNPPFSVCKKPINREWRSGGRAGGTQSGNPDRERDIATLPLADVFL